MNTSVQALTAAAQKVPGYCTSGVGVHTPQQWQTCWNAGWSQPVNGAASAGSALGGSFGPILVIALIALGLFLLTRTRRTATS